MNKSPRPDFIVDHSRPKKTCECFAESLIVFVVVTLAIAVIVI